MLGANENSKKKGWLRKAREDERDQDDIGLSFESKCYGGWREFFSTNQRAK